MSGYKDPDFQDRRALAQKARAKALEKLADAPKLDEATIAKRKAAQEAREAAIVEKSAAKRAAIAQAKADKLAAAAAKAEAEAVPAPTEAELKAARDAKYAARKKRKKG
tara:strand:+ start:63 stop:389 length:327 start_codon:yes stop_codon:yes gene_type:complete